MSQQPELTRVTIVEDHELFAEALDLALTLRGHRVRRVQAQEPGPGRLVQAVVGQRPDVVVLDLDLGPSGDGARLIPALREAGIAVLVVSGESDRARLGECLRLGAQAVLEKSAPLDAIVTALHQLARGLPAMSQSERDELMSSTADQDRSDQSARERLESLSPREEAVLADLVAGRTVQEIARRSTVSEATVRTQVKSIRTKLEVHSQLAAVGVARRARWRQAT